MGDQKKRDSYNEITKKRLQNEQQLLQNKQNLARLEIQSEEIYRLGRSVDRDLSEMEGLCTNGERSHLIRQTRNDHQAGCKHLNRTLEKAYEDFQKEQRALQEEWEDVYKQQREDRAGAKK